MPNDVVATEVVEDDNIGFEDGFNTARGVESPAPSEEPPIEPKEAEEPVAEEKTEPEPVEETVTLTQSEVKNLLSQLNVLEKHQQSIDKAHGRLGSLQETITKLQTAQSTGGPVELTDEDVADIAGEYPDLGGKLKATLAKVLGKVRGGQAPAFDIEPIKQEFEQKRLEDAQKYEKKLLTVMRKDWSTVVKSDDFNLWLAGQDEAYRNQIANSWEATEVFEAIQKFEEAKAAKTPDPEPPPPTKTEDKKKRLEMAETPKGVKAPDTSALNEEDAFAQGFKRARGGG